MGTLKKPIETGEISGSASAKQCPAVAIPLTVRLKALATNSQSVYVGLANTVTVADGTQDALTGYPLAAGESIELGVDDLSDLWIICDVATDDLAYMVFGG